MGVRRDQTQEGSDSAGVEGLGRRIAKLGLLQGHVLALCCNVSLEHLHLFQSSEGRRLTTFPRGWVGKFGLAGKYAG